MFVLCPGELPNEYESEACVLPALIHGLRGAAAESRNSVCNVFSKFLQWLTDSPVSVTLRDVTGRSGGTVGTRSRAEEGAGMGTPVLPACSPLVLPVGILLLDFRMPHFCLLPPLCSTGIVLLRSCNLSRCLLGEIRKECVHL